MPTPEIAARSGQLSPECPTPDTDAGTPPVPHGSEPPGGTGLDPRPAVALAFGLGELSATGEAMTAAHTGGVEIVALVLRHLSCDWGDIDPAGAAANDEAVTNGRPLHSAYRIAGSDAVVVVTTDGPRRRTVAHLASETGWTADGTEARGN